MDAFVGEIRIFPFDFAPKGWAFCDGQLMLISQNTGLFYFLGAAFGGDGTTTFALPDLRGAAGIGQGQGDGLNYVRGQAGGADTVILSEQEMPSHRHTVSAATVSATLNDPSNAVWAKAGAVRQPQNQYRTPAAGTVNMAQLAFTTVGSSMPHNNMPPYLTLNFCIALQGVFATEWS